MSAVKHSPGPWTRGPPESHYSIATIIDARDFVVAEVFCGDENDLDGRAESEADLKVLLAAPGLADILEQVWSEFDDRYDGAPDSGTRWMGRLIDEVRDALRAAGRLP